MRLTPLWRPVASAGTRADGHVDAGRHPSTAPRARRAVQHGRHLLALAATAGLALTGAGLAPAQAAVLTDAGSGVGPAVAAASAQPAAAAPAAASVPVTDSTGKVVLTPEQATGTTGVRGDVQFIAVLIEFPDESLADVHLDSPETLAVQDMIASKGGTQVTYYDERVPIVPMSEYFTRNTYGQISMHWSSWPQREDGTVVSYQAEHSIEYYQSDYVKLLEMLNAAMDAVRPQLEATFTKDQLDRDGDGWIDALAFFPEYPPLWDEPPSWDNFYPKSWPGGITNAGHGLSGQFVMLPVTNMDYQSGVFSHKVTSDGTIELNAARYSTIYHELGHLVLGLKDFYRQGDGFVKGFPVSSFDIMGTDITGQPQGYLADTLERLGAVNIPDAAPGVQTTLVPRSFQDANEANAVKIKVPGYDNQYLVVEYYRSRGLQEDPSSHSGLIVYRVNGAYSWARLYPWNPLFGSSSEYQWWKRYRYSNTYGSKVSASNSTNSVDKDYLYVFRPGEAEAGDGHYWADPHRMENAVISEAGDYGRSLAGRPDNSWQEGSYYFIDGITDAVRGQDASTAGTIKPVAVNSGVVLHVTEVDGEHATFSWELTTPGAVTRTVTFAGADGTAAQTVDDGAALVLPTPAARPGYRFLGWSVPGAGADGAAALKQAGDEVTVGADLTVTAQWEALEYQVTYQWDGEAPASATLPTDSATYHWHDSLTPDEAGGTLAAGAQVRGEKNGKQGTWTFSGWQDTTGLSADGVEGDVTFTGSWSFEQTVFSYTVRHYEQDVEGNGYTLAASDELTGPAGTVTAQARDIEGFTLNQDRSQLTGDLRADGLTLDIYYDRQTIELDFVNMFGDADATGEDAQAWNKTVRYGQTITMPTPKPREGWTFKYWEGSVYYPGDAYVVTGPHHFEAVWERNEYHVTYEWAGAAPSAVSLPTDSTTYHWHDAVTLADGDGTLTAGAKVSGTHDGVEGTWIFEGWKPSAGLTEAGIEDNVTVTGSWCFEPKPTTSDQGTQTDNPGTSDGGTQTDPPSTSDGGTQTDNPGTSDSGTQTDPPSTSDGGTQTDNPGTSDGGTQTDNPGTSDGGTQTDNPGTVDGGTQTDLPDFSAGIDIGTQTDPEQPEPVTPDEPGTPDEPDTNVPTATPAEPSDGTQPSDASAGEITGTGTRIPVAATGLRALARTGADSGLLAAAVLLVAAGGMLTGAALRRRRS